MALDSFARRRKSVLDLIRPGALVAFAAPVALRNRDVEHEYRQDSDFYYLTAFEEPESVAVLGGAGEAPFVMIVRPRDPEREVWDGPRAGVEGAVAVFGADTAYPREQLEQRLVELLTNVPRLYYELGRDRDADEVVLRAIARLRARARQGAVWPTEIVEPSTALHELRLRKHPDEIEKLEHACRITEQAHLEAMARAEPGQREYEVEAVLRAHFLRHGARRVSYQPTVASGPNATVLHYNRNDRQMQDGELVLVDAGCEYAYYAADITRTFPVGGRFGVTQAAVYDVVVEAQTCALGAVRPGATLDDVHRACVETITEGLVELGLVSGPVADAVREERHKPYFMHRTGHFLGMDVHDVGTPYPGGQSRVLEPGMVLTVEPGLYFSPSDEAVPERFRGIGVRIEDDVLVTAEGARVLGDGIPKRREDVERACRR